MKLLHFFIQFLWGCCFSVCLMKKHFGHRSDLLVYVLCALSLYVNINKDMTNMHFLFQIPLTCDQHETHWLTFILAAFSSAFRSFSLNSWNFQKAVVSVSVASALHKKMPTSMSSWWLAVTQRCNCCSVKAALARIHLPKVPCCSVSLQHKPGTAERRWIKSICWCFWRQSLLCFWTKLMVPLLEKEMYQLEKKMTEDYWWRKNQMDFSCC